SREITKSEVYKLHNDYSSHKNVEELSNSIKINLQGWRELFYGDRIQARKHFVTNLNSAKVCIAFLLTFLSQSKIDLLLERNLFARLKYVIHYFDPEMVGIRHTLKQLLK
ncbi:MAG: hypothetical protein KJZ60_12190, partial [Ignavibacteriaceae bacterium]|nr:hypothetical protein [Ignavibacteriaceae bacterium]